MTRPLLIYIAAPLFSEAERSFNLRLNEFVQSCGFETYLPQLDGGLLTDLVSRGADEDCARRQLFERDLEELDRADVLLILMDGRAVDEGACFELGYAHCLGKRCVGFKTDSRSLIRGRDSLMLCGAVERVATDWPSLRALLGQLGEAVQG